MMQNLHETAKGIYSLQYLEQTGTKRRSEFSVDDGFYLDQSYSGSTQFGFALEEDP